MSLKMRIGDKQIGEKCPTYFIAEIGINHNGDIEIAKKLIDAAKQAGCDAVKFQKRTPEKCVPKDQWEILRETPWGLIKYIDYRRKIEFGKEEYSQIDSYCNRKKIDWSVSVWDEESVDFIEEFNPSFYKIPSASLTDDNLIRYVKRKNKPIMLSTGMSTMDQIRHAVKLLEMRSLILLHCNSSYPANVGELNLRVINTLQKEFDCIIGYSGHEVGLQTTTAAVVLGAKVVERHITLDRAMWGSDQAASVEPHGLSRLVRDIRIIEAALGNGQKKVYDSEIPSMKKLRRIK
jgi:N-acetylneuraminate synthase